MARKKSVQMALPVGLITSGREADPEPFHTYSQIGFEARIALLVMQNGTAARTTNWFGVPGGSVC